MMMTPTVRCANYVSLRHDSMENVSYLHARSPTSANNGMSPYEKLHGYAPEVIHLRRFGCWAYRTLPPLHRIASNVRWDEPETGDASADAGTDANFEFETDFTIEDDAGHLLDSEFAAITPDSVGTIEITRVEDKTVSTMSGKPQCPDRYNLRKRPSAVAYQIRVEPAIRGSARSGPQLSTSNCGH